ncbi:formate dehydrogenase accessory protein FdhD [Marinomonas ushuaiensis DSM 15871]|uniref:Sulfur carrier protein FdhD n=1 Tax=Marinomonas ushuaiensis DSM 15871 TaxID=1122207 RepID=X7E563_9GAMM|nr:formate dehydrogenase accessory sulfurtransferase FdhD [Marinomonas ushuaiensis]ETX11092.1 formate dehydrogenase accessory protein FdhD [Marinomonas ushuaiensis DSM 15871]
MSNSLISSGYQNKTFYRSASLQISSFTDSNTQKETPKESEPSTPLVEETPLAISINGIAYAVMMVTPIDLESFVIGFALSEGIIENLNEIRDIDIQPTSTPPNIDSISINLELSPRRSALFKQKKQAHLGATGCGLCGVESLSQAIPTLSKLTTSTPMNEDVLVTLRHRLSEHQVLGNKTGAIHAALLVSPQNEVICCMEDIGRHNTLDKIIGYALKQDIKLHNHTVLMSSRCSTELVQKAVRVGLSHLVHLASPSTLAVKLARYYGLTLIHLPKKDAPRIFAPFTTSELKPKDTIHE